MIRFVARCRATILGLIITVKDADFLTIVPTRKLIAIANIWRFVDFRDVNDGIVAT
jgi:hypothetical protein